MRANSWISSAVSTGSGVPSTCGAPARCAMWRAETLSPSERIAWGGGTDPGEPGVDHGLGEVGVLGQEAVAGVHRVGTALAGDVEQLLDHEVGLGGRRAAQRVRLVRDLDVQRVAVGVGVHGDAGDAGVTAGPGDADGDLATVGDEDLGDGHRWCAPVTWDEAFAAAPSLPERAPLAGGGADVRVRDVRDVPGAGRPAASSASLRLAAAGDVVDLAQRARELGAPGQQVGPDGLEGGQQTLDLARLARLGVVHVDDLADLGQRHAEPLAAQREHQAGPVAGVVAAGGSRPGAGRA